MRLNISELRLRYIALSDCESHVICQLLDIVEAVKRGFILHESLNDGVYRTDADYEKTCNILAECNKGIRELLDDVEVDE